MQPSGEPPIQPRASGPPTIHTPACREAAQTGISSTVLTCDVRSIAGSSRWICAAESCAAHVIRLARPRLRG